MLPPEIKPNFNDNSNWHKAFLLGFEDIREYEEMKELECITGNL